MTGVKRLHVTLTQAGQHPEVLTFADGTRLLLLPRGGRVLGVFPPESEENVLWTHPALSSVATARAYLARDGWPNPGGDRTWLAPEIDLFIGDPARPSETYAVPTALDPGAWTLAVTDGVAHLETTARLSMRRAGQDVGMHLCRSISPATNPLADAGVQYAGYTLVTTLAVTLRTEMPVRLGIWNLLQLPPSGVMVIPTHCAGQPRCVFGTVAAEELVLEPHVVCWKMADRGDDAKIAIKARPLTGRVGYLRRSASPGVWDLVVRTFAVDPDGDYVDALWEPPHETGWAFQACCVRAGVERFNELEYHTPAVSTIDGANTYRDESRLWAFRGPVAAIVDAGAVLLGVDLATMIDGFI